MSKIELTGEYHSDINMLLGKVTRLEKFKLDVSLAWETYLQTGMDDELDAILSKSIQTPTLINRS